MTNRISIPVQGIAFALASAAAILRGNRRGLPLVGAPSRPLGTTYRGPLWTRWVYVGVLDPDGPPYLVELFPWERSAMLAGRLA